MAICVQRLPIFINMDERALKMRCLEGTMLHDENPSRGLLLAFFQSGHAYVFRRRKPYFAFEGI